MQRRPFLALLCLLSLAATAQAEDFKLGENPVSVILRWRPTTPDPEVKEFVRASRPADGALEYTPLTQPKVERPKLKTKEELRAMVEGMDRAGGALKKRSGPVAGADSAGTARALQAAAAESRRRAAQDFDVSAKPAAPAAQTPRPVVKKVP